MITQEYSEIKGESGMIADRRNNGEQIYWFRMRHKKSASAQFRYHGPSAFCDVPDADFNDRIKRQENIDP
jgi:hypothetical protein